MKWNTVWVIWVMTNCRIFGSYVITLGDCNPLSSRFWYLNKWNLNMIRKKLWIIIQKNLEIIWLTRFLLNMVIGYDTIISNIWEYRGLKTLQSFYTFSTHLSCYSVVGNFRYFFQFRLFWTFCQWTKARIGYSLWPRFLYCWLSICNWLGWVRCWVSFIFQNWLWSRFFC